MLSKVCEDHKAALLFYSERRATRMSTELDNNNSDENQIPTAYIFFNLISSGFVRCKILKRPSKTYVVTDVMQYASIFTNFSSEFA